MPYLTRGRELGIIAAKTPIALAVASLCGAGAARAQNAAPTNANILEEVVVTAGGRQETAQDIPYNITVKTGEDLKESGVTDLAGLARQVPGMAYTDLGVRSNGVNSGIILRGLNGTTIGGQSANSPAAGDLMVSTYINSTPLFSNLKITDVERVEVLRGPQGTLYGAGSIGGTVRFIFNKPDTSKFSADVQTKLAAVQDANDPNYSVDAVVNLPLSARFALRLSAGYEDVPGVVDATHLEKLDAQGHPIPSDPSDYFGSGPVFYRKNNVDDADIRYARGALLWNVSDSFSALLTVQHQETNASDFTGQSPYGPKREETRFRTSPSHTKVDLYALELTAELGFATLTSATSATKSVLDSQMDDTNFGLESQDFYAGFPRVSAYTDVDYTTKNFIEELRLVSKPGGDWDWVAGAYYSDYKQTAQIGSAIAGWAEFTNTPGHPAAVAALGPGATWADYYHTFYPDGTFDSDVTYSLAKKVKNPNSAIYGELTYHLTPAWDVTAGARAFWVKNDRGALQYFPADGSAGTFDAGSTSKTNDHLFKFNTAYKLSQNSMIYFTWSQGFRQGGSNALPLAGPYAVDPKLIPYRPDFADNFELGAKGSVGGRFQYSGALYKVNWKDMQVQIGAPGSGIPTLINGGTAVSQGVEFEAKVLLSETMNLTMGYTYTDAKLTEDVVFRSGVTGSDGDRLPGVPKNTATLGFNFYQPGKLAGGELTYHLDGAYRSGANTALNGDSANFAALGGFSTWNGSLNWTRDKLRLGVFVNNITDEAGVTAVGITPELARPPGDIYFIQRPRTIGVTMGYRF